MKTYLPTFILIYTVLFLTSCSRFSIQKNPHIVLDTKSPRQILNLFKFMKKSDSKTEIRERINIIIATKAYQTMFSHYNRSWNPNKLPKESMVNMILSLKYSDAYKGHEHRVTNYMKKVWQKYYKNTELFEKEIEYFNNIDMDSLISNAVNKALSLLPNETKIPDFYFFIHPNGRSNGFVINNSHGLDFFQLPKNDAGIINKDHLEVILAHEIHHLGITSLMPKELYSTKEEIALNVISMPIAEGIANKFINNAPGGCTSKIYPNKKSYYTPESLDGWKKYTKSEAEMFNKFVNLYNRANSGNLTKKQFYHEFKNYWIKSENKSRPRFYFLGAELMGVIYQGLGLNALFDVMKDPSKLFLIYNQALNNNPTLKSKCPSIQKQLVIKVDNVRTELKQ